MTDIVERLRDPCDVSVDQFELAANEIERLRELLRSCPVLRIDPFVARARGEVEALSYWKAVQEWWPKYKGSLNSSATADKEQR